MAWKSPRTKSKDLCALIACLGLLVPAFAEVFEGKSLNFELPANAKIEAKSDLKMEFYSVTLGDSPQQGLLMIHQSPVPASKEMLKPMAEMMRVGFSKQMEKNDKFKLSDQETKQADFKKGIWEGIEIRFTGTAESGMKVFQLMYVLWDGANLWNAQFTGKESAYEEVVTILEKMTKK